MQAFVLSAGGDGAAEHALRPRLMPPRIEDEFPALRRAFDIPACEGLRDFDDILLGVTTVHAEGVQLHQPARVVFVDAQRTASRLRHAAGTPCGERVRADALRPSE